MFYFDSPNGDALRTRCCKQSIGRNSPLPSLVGAISIIWAKGVLSIHAISEEAKQFYEQYRFTASSLEPLTLMVKVSDVAKSLGLPE
jgi:hypothetical protein